MSGDEIVFGSGSVERMKKMMGQSDGIPRRR